MRTTATALLIAGATTLAGCAGTDGTPSAPRSTAPASAPPSAAASVPALPPGAIPSGAPKTPTDIVRTAGWIEGTVSRGGNGPCYGVTTWDGLKYAVYSDAGVELAEGSRVKAQVKPATLRISCGDGEQVEASAIERLP